MTADATFRPCTYCEGHGCSECDGTGARFHATIALEDGTFMRVSGSGAAPSQDTLDALRTLGRAACEHLGLAAPSDEERER